MNEAKQVEELKLDDTVKQNSKGEAILGTLEGPCADFINPTRNGRKYDEDLWEKVFSDPIVNEYFECGGIPGELDHPADRLETCSEKIAIMMPEKPHKDKDGHLIARFDILDTPNGRIAYTLAKYGYKLGISSRGGGDTYTDADGNESVDSSTYDFQGFDLVLLPAVKAARLKMVESLGGKTFKTAINEALAKATPDEKKVMQETLENLKLLKEDTTSAASNAGASVVKDLQESLLKNQVLENQNATLQEKLSVCYAKEAKYEEDIAKYKTAIRNLSEKASNVKSLQSKVEALTEQLSEKDSLIKVEQDKANTLLAKNRAGVSRQSNLTEAVSAKQKQVDQANQQVKLLTERLEKQKALAKEKQEALEESLAEAKKDLSIKKNEYNTKIAKTNELVEKYRKIAKIATNKYIESKSVMLGIEVSDIEAKLPTNYSFRDIDVVCESLSNMKLNVGSLPMDLQSKQIKKVQIKESKDRHFIKSNVDDDVDDTLITLAKQI